MNMTNKNTRFTFEMKITVERNLALINIFIELPCCLQWLHKLRIYSMHI